MALSQPRDFPWASNGSVGSSTTSNEVGERERAWSGPRTIQLQKCERGFGFTLRHFIVYPPPDAMKLQQVDNDGTKIEMSAMDTIFVKHVKDGSPAQRAGLNTGDRIISVNGESIAGKSYAQVIQLIQRSGNVLQLRVVPKEDDILQLYFPGTAYRSTPFATSSSSVQPPTSLPIQPPTDGSDPIPSPSDLGRRRYSELPSLFQPTSLVSGSSQSGSTWSVSNAGLNYGTSGDRSRSSSDLSPASSSSSSSRPLIHPVPYLRPWPLKSNYNVFIQPCPPAPEYVTSSSGTVGHYSTNSETGMTLNASAPSSVTSSREASIERPDVNDSIINRIRVSFEKKEEFLLRTGPAVVNQRLFNVAAVSSSGGSTTGNDSAISSSSASSPTQVISSTPGGSGVSSSSHFNYVTPVRTLMGIELEEPALPPLVKQQTVEEGKSTGETQSQQSNIGVRQLRKAASLDSGNHIPPTPIPTKPHLNTTGTGSAGSIMSDPNGSQGLHLVSQRAKLFETGTLEQEANNRMKLYKNELARMTTRGQTPRVSDRAAQFESLSTSQETIGSESDYSSSPRQKPNKGDVLGQMMRSAIGKMTTSDIKTNSHASTLRGTLVGNAAGSDEDRSAASTETDDEDEDSQRHRALRQNSYLAAVRAPFNDVRKHRSKHRHHHHGRSKSSPGFAQQSGAVSVTFSEILPATPVLYRVAPLDSHYEGGVSPSVVSGVPLRRRVLYEDEDNRANRRISYLKATSGDGRVGVNFRLGEEDEEEETEEECTTPPSSSSSASRLTTSNTETKSTSSAGSKVQSIQKLKSFFGERTPQIVHAATEKGRLFRDFPAVSSLLLPTTTSSLTKEGWLHCKVATIDGKRATDRSWKQLWAILKGHTLHLYKDRKDAFQHQTSQAVEEHPIDLLRCRLETASDYTKKKHVFRIVTACGSEYLFQAENHAEMQKWIHEIQSAVDNNEMCVISQGIVQKKSAIFEREISQQHQTHAPGSKGIKKLAPFRSRSPTGHSPTSKTRKSSHGEDSSPKSKTWRGKMVKTIRKIHGTSPAAGVTGGVTVGISLDECPTSASNEFVPLLVELCTSIVEARGLEVIGIYRVPGNTAAVSYLLDSVDRGFDQLNLQDPRWSDVNVISSLLKAFFRKLPEPLLTCELYPFFIEASKSDNPDRRMYELKKMLHQLPDHNFETLKYLIRHLQKVVEHSNVNKMEARNLAIVFGPTLVRAADDNMVTMVKDMSFQCRIVETLINYGDWFFSSDENEDISNRYFGGREGVAVLDAPMPNANVLLLNNVMKIEHAQAEMRSKDVSAKDLVSSIIGAANRKVKQKMKRYAMVHDTMVPDDATLKNDSVEERDIDREIELRLHSRNGAVDTKIVSERNGEATLTEVKSRHDRRHSEDSTISSMSTRAPSEDFTYLRKMSVDSLDSLTLTPRNSGDKERAFCVVRPTPSEKRTTWDNGSSQVTTPPQQSPQTPKNLLKEGENSEHSVLKTYAGLSASMQERIRKFELETKALLQRDSSATKGDLQLDRQRIEAEWQRAKLDLEQDDFLDRLADNPSTVNTTAANKATVKAESTSSPPKNQRQHTTVSQSPQHHERRGERPIPWPINPHNRRTAASARTDMKRVSSVENFGERATGRISAKGWASQRRKAISTEVPPGGEDPLQGGGGAAKWCGSLDSLREFYDSSNAAGLHGSERNDGFGMFAKTNVSRSSENFPDQPYKKVPSGEANSRSKSLHKRSSSEIRGGNVESEKPVSNTDKLEDLKRDDNETDVSFQRNENTLITATLSTTANTISTTTLTSVMTATIKSTKPTLGHRGSDPTSLNGSVVAFREKRYDSSGNQKRLSSVVVGSKKGRGSPPPSSASQRKSSHLRSLKRRHTVGGTKDFEKFRMLVSGSDSGHGNQIEMEIPTSGNANSSAWERLRPAVPPEQRSMKSWLRMERLRTSSPELQLPISVDNVPESLMDVDERKPVYGNPSLAEIKPETTALMMPSALESQV